MCGHSLVAKNRGTSPDSQELSSRNWRLFRTSPHQCVGEKMAHQIEDLEVEEEEYDEKADEDFNPAAAAADEDASSSSDEEESAPVKPKQAKKPAKRKSEVVDELDSGDEAMIQERKKRRRRGGDDVESGGEGGLVKTRAQRLAEKVEKKQRRKATEGEVTIDVDKVWADLSSIPVGRPVDATPNALDVVNADADAEQNKENAPAPRPSKDETITIKRRIEYAGEVTEVEEVVLRNSKEAQHYLAEHAEADPTNPANNTLFRPLKRPSLFEPNPLATIKNVPPEKLRPHTPSRQDVLLAANRAEEERQKKAERMTTVQKSALDWRGFVDQQGLQEELDEYGKSKGGFMGREDFLDRTQFARDVQAREARMKG